MKKPYFIFSLFLTTFSCQSLSIMIPVPKVEPPITSGKNKINVGGEVKTAGSFEATSNAGARPPNLNNSNLSEGVFYGGQVEYGILENLSVNLKIELGETLSSNYIQGELKYLILGNSWANKSFGPQLMTWVTLGSGSKSTSGDQKIEFGSGLYPWKASMHDSVSGAGISYGQIISEKLLIYLGGAYNDHVIRLNIDHLPAEDNSDSGASYEKTYGGYAYSVSAGIKTLWRVFSMEVFGGYATGKFESNSISKNGPIFGIKFIWLLNPSASTDPLSGTVPSI